MSTIRREFRIKHLKGFLAGNLFKLYTELKVLIGEAKYVNPTFSELEIKSILESASQSKLEFKSNLLQVAV